MTFKPLKKPVESLLDLNDIQSFEPPVNGKSYVLQFVQNGVEQHFQLVEGGYAPPSAGEPIVNLDNIQNGDILVFSDGKWINIPEDDVISYQDVFDYPLLAKSSILYILKGSSLRAVNIFESTNEYFLFKDANTINGASDYITITSATYTFENGTNSYVLRAKGEFVQFRNVNNILVRV